MEPPMTYVIPEPCIDVKDRACIEECAAERICEGERMLSIDPGECAGWCACEPVRAVEAIFYKDDVPRAVDSVHRRERQILRPARQLRRGAVARGVLAQQWRGGRANADPAADRVPLGNPIRSAGLRVPGGQAAWVYSLITPHCNTACGVPELSHRP
jgi:NAD-dependent dihydropyrimidine dehydrogenase PreA subunit